MVPGDKYYNTFSVGKRKTAKILLLFPKCAKD
jgi:hypothetical protein